MATKKLLFGLFLLLVTQEAQGIVSNCEKSAVEVYGKRGQVVPRNCATKVNTICWVQCRVPSNNEMRISCNENGEWEEDGKCWIFIPECEEYSDRGVIVKPGCVRDVGKTCDVSCNGGGFMEIRCNRTIQWEVVQNFSCVRVIPECEEYSDTGVTVIPGCVRDVGKTCGVSCNGGGFMEIRCNRNRQWEVVQNFSCVRVIPECEEYSYTGVIVKPGCVRDEGKTCDVSCNGGGFMEIRCNRNIQWEVVQNFSCVRGCPKADVENAFEVTNQFDSEVGKTVEFTCEYRFVIQGHEKITCQANYTWDHTDTRCESRRFADEVVKAMEDFFFSEINENNAQDLDLIILLDVSDYEWVRITVDLVKSLLLRSEENQRRKFYSLITYGKEGHVECTVCNNETIIKVLNGVAKRQNQPAGSNLGSGLSRIFTRLLLEDRLSMHRDRILLLVTGQNPGISHNHELWTKILRDDADFKMFVVSLDDGVHKDVNQEEMKRLADQPWQNHYFHLEYSEIHEAVGNLTNDESGIINNTGHLVQQMKRSLNAGKVSRMFICMDAGNSSEIFTLVKQVTMNILQCMVSDQPKLEVDLNTDDVVGFISVDAAISKLNGLQLSALQKLAQPQYQMTKRVKDNYLPIILFISSSGRIFDNGSIHFMKDMGYEIYAVGVGEQAKMEDMQDLVSFPWYRHLVLASEGTVVCDS